MAALLLCSNSFLTNLRNVEPLHFFPVENTYANPILHRKSSVSGDLQNKSAILFDPWAIMDHALEHDPAAALFHPVYTAQNRHVLRTKSTASRIFATLYLLVGCLVFVCSIRQAVQGHICQERCRALRR